MWTLLNPFTGVFVLKWQPCVGEQTNRTFLSILTFLQHRKLINVKKINTFEYIFDTPDQTSACPIAVVSSTFSNHTRLIKMPYSTRAICDHHIKDTDTDE